MTKQDVILQALSACKAKHQPNLAGNAVKLGMIEHLGAPVPYAVMDNGVIFCPFKPLSGKGMLSR